MKYTFYLFLLMLFGCTENLPDSQFTISDESAEQEVTIETGVVLATVDNVPVYELELEVLLKKLFGEREVEQFDDSNRKRALDSLISSQLLSRKAVSELSKRNLDEIDIRTRHYRENLLINAYMKTKIEPSQISTQQIKEYYNKNLETFGSKIVKQYQMLTSAKKMSELSREKFLKIVSLKKNGNDLEPIQNALKSEGFNTRLTTAYLNEAILENRLFQFIDNQPIGAVSDLYLVKGSPYLVKVLSEKKLQARPLSEVSETIRKSLLYAKIKLVIKQHTALALAQANIVYRQE